MKGRLGKDSSAAAGRRGEEAAAERLESENWLVLARNYRAGPGEIDIVAAKDGILCFVEVKSWERLGSEQLADSINAAKRRRILETAKIFSPGIENIVAGGFASMSCSCGEAALSNTTSPLSRENYDRPRIV